MKRTEPTRTPSQWDPAAQSLQSFVGGVGCLAAMQSPWLYAFSAAMQDAQMSALNAYYVGQQDAMRNALSPPGPRKTMPTRTLLQGAPYVPSWAMHWRSTLVPYLAGHSGLVGGWRDQIARNVKEADK